MYTYTYIFFLFLSISMCVHFAFYLHVIHGWGHADIASGGGPASMGCSMFSDPTVAS